MHVSMQINPICLIVFVLEIDSAVLVIELNISYPQGRKNKSKSSFSVNKGHKTNVLSQMAQFK